MSTQTSIKENRVENKRYKVCPYTVSFSILGITILSLLVYGCGILMFFDIGWWCLLSLFLSTSIIALFLPNLVDQHVVKNILKISTFLWLICVVLFTIGYSEVWVIKYFLS